MPITGTCTRMKSPSTCTTSLKLSSYTTTIDRTASSACFCEDDITDLDTAKGISQVNSFKAQAHQYIVDFFVPTCSCPDWTQYHYPCKRFLKVFFYVLNGTGIALPDTYRTSLRLSLDIQRHSLLIFQMTVP